MDRVTVQPRDDVTEPLPAVHLIPTEWRLLRQFVRHPDQVLTHTELLTAVWGPGHEAHDEYLRVYLNSLRRKLEPDPARPRHLITEPGLGHRFEPGP
ncbi:winged helix-turn-helix domain-containing protein [Streptacidiphilus anmyonensis]|uniref:winged helix-turn-helix domain-containing protein n=1 Tax=Streptacidiphilus anmyonensis TaxID=405782 RepID=UPI00128E2C5A|nr:winged helix-turn-helix domain-containing protein [Streptacidiphilus anmyonensis]